MFITRFSSRFVFPAGIRSGILFMIFMFSPEPTPKGATKLWDYSIRYSAQLVEKLTVLAEPLNL
jgi:hypothetical protein